jgi:hypothetical protein
MRLARPAVPILGPVSADIAGPMLVAGKEVLVFVEICGKVAIFFISRLPEKSSGKIRKPRQECMRQTERFRDFCDIPGSCLRKRRIFFFAGGCQT